MADKKERIGASAKMRAGVFANDLGDLVFAVGKHEIAGIIWDDDDDGPLLVVWSEPDGVPYQIDLFDLFPSMRDEVKA